jgi:hypothetical protein
MRLPQTSSRELPLVVVELSDGEELTYPFPDNITDEKVRETMRESLIDAIENIPMWNPPEHRFSVVYCSESLLVLHNSYSSNGLNRRTLYHLYLNFDMHTGEILYLDDIVDVEALMGIMSVSGGFRESGWNNDDEGYWSQELIGRQWNTISSQLKSLCDPPSESMYPNYYIKDGRLHLVDVIVDVWSMYPNHIECYVELNDIKHILKIDV